MKTKILLGFTLIISLVLIMSGTTSAFASLADNKPTIISNDFSLRHSVSLSSGNFVLAGWQGPPADQIPTLLEIKADGTIVEEMHPNDGLDSSLYEYVVPLPNHSYMAFRSINENTASIGEVISDGKVIGSIDMPPNLRGVFPLSDGFLLLRADDFYELIVEKRNFDGQKIWDYHFEEALRISDCTEQEGFYQLVGGTSENLEAAPMGIMLRFSSDGELLWRYDSNIHEEYTHVLSCENGNVIVAANVLGSEINEGYTYCYIAQFNNETLVWKTDCMMPSTNVDVGSILFHSDGYLLAIHGGQGIDEVGYPKKELLLQYYDTNGLLLHSWCVPMIMQNSFHFHLYHQNDQVYLIVSGNEAPFDPIQNATSIQPIFIGEGR